MTKTALLVMDVQNDIVERFSGGSSSLLPVLARVTAAARQAKIPVVYVRLAFRPGWPEVSEANSTFSALARAGRMGIGDPATEIHPDVTPQPGDIVVTKKRVSAFVGSDLTVVLGALGVTSLVLTGIATSGVVLSTLRQAADMDYDCTVLEDGCADGDAEVHSVLLNKVFRGQAAVLTSEQWLARVNASTG